MHIYLICMHEIRRKYVFSVELPWLTISDEVTGPDFQ